jgi:NitT/TauT family transport system substrate-binding protein
MDKPLRHPTRRGLLAGATAFAAAAPVRRAAAAESIAVRLDWSTTGLNAPFFLAQKRGWFADQGLDVSIEDGNGSATTVQLIAAGQFDVGVAALGPMALAVGKGAAVISTAGFVQRGDTGFIVPADSGWTTPHDLIGKIWDYTAGSLEGPFMLPFLKKNGMTPDQVTLLNVAASAKFPVYIEKKADTMVSTVPMNIPMVAASRPSRGILFADFGLNLPGEGLVVNTATLARKGDAIRRFTSVVCAAWTYILAGPAQEQESIDAILTYRPNPPTPGPIMRQEVDEYKPFFQTATTKGMPIGVQAAADWADVIASMAGAGTIPATIKPAQMFTNDYIDAAIVKKITGIS